MTKIMLVEDDKSLREIYGVRLLAEGYDIVSAGDGEEALAMAIKERPKLIITDVMMPKISGFDMLDILRSTTETRDIKVIMMTALSSDDQRARGEQMGADRYLVKSQVGIEDVVRVVHEVLGDSPAAAPPPMRPAAPAFSASTGATPLSSTTPVPPPVSAVPAPPTPPNQAPPIPVTTMPAPSPIAPPVAPMPRTMPAISSTAAPPPSARQRIIQPISSPNPSVNINDLLDRELARETANNPGGGVPQVATTAQERAVVQNQINAFGAAPTPPPAQPQPSVAAPTQFTPPPEPPQAPRPITVQVPERPTQPPVPPSAPTA